ncbi:hypothetical protein BXZ70DRAFT_1009955 [Cristinia sonorae]|uniref:NmrA-like domain-containing protein n=1 Tax=Cristinia sonorae TaxID=1940300 RepID=A0A8K0UJ76_9AGAR|nr:hypothetical protein BXZ70DRAFT_1009955 [Cristinia sonorae]
MVTSQQKILFIGATGYIGGSVFDEVLKHPQVSQFDITVYIRSEAKAKKLAALGLDLKLVLAGAKKAYAATKVPPVIIHTVHPSAHALHLELNAVFTAIVGDMARGEFTSVKVFDDAGDETVLENLPITVMHRDVDIPLAVAHEEGYVKTFVIVPPLVYGLPTGVLAKAGIQNRIPMGVSLVCDIAIARGALGLVGPGRNIWSLIEVHDLARLYITLLDAILEGKDLAGGKAYYAAVDGEVVWRDSQIKLAEILHEVGYLKSSQVDEYTQEEIAKWPFLTPLASNARMSDSRSRSLGWKPTHSSPRDFFESLRETVEIMAEQGNWQPSN